MATAPLGSALRTKTTVQLSAEGISCDDTYHARSESERVNEPSRVGRGVMGLVALAVDRHRWRQRSLYMAAFCKHIIYKLRAANGIESYSSRMRWLALDRIECVVFVLCLCCACVVCVYPRRCSMLMLPINVCLRCRICACVSLSVPRLRAPYSLCCFEVTRVGNGIGIRKYTYTALTLSCAVSCLCCVFRCAVCAFGVWRWPVIELFGCRIGVCRAFELSLCVSVRLCGTTTATMLIASVIVSTRIVSLCGGAQDGNVSE